MISAFTRRDFLKTSGAALALATVNPGALAAEAKPASAEPKRALKKGIMWATVGVTGSVAEKMKAIKAAGFDGVEMTSHLDVEEVLRARDELGLEIPSVCDSVHWAKTLSDPDPAVRADGLAGLQQSLRDAKRYGASSVLLVPAVVSQTVSYADAYTRSQAEIRRAIPLAEELGIKIAIENVWNHFLLSPLEAARYVDEFNSPAIGWHFDVGNIINNGWPEQWIRILGPRILKLHIKEFSRKQRDQQGLWKGFAVEFLTGDNNWPAVMKALDDVNYHGWAIAEPAWKPEGVPPAERIRQIAGKLDQILAS